MADGVAEKEFERLNRYFVLSSLITSFEVFISWRN
jgi:hypothetical protein